MAYDNNMSGVLFKNNDKQKETHPDYKGSCEVDGVHMWISAWIKEGKNGKFMSLSFKPKEAQQEKKSPPKKAFTVAPEKPKGVVPFDDMDDDIPFN